jgi:hypothetical protein
MESNRRNGRQAIKRGQVIVLITMALPAILGSIALVADVGRLYFNWAILQAAADAGAVAGADYLPSNPAIAVSTADLYAEKNGILPSEIVSTNVLANATELNIQLRRTIPYSFAVLVGITTGVVSAQATAQVQTIGSTSGIKPMGIDYRTTYSSGQIVMLMMNQVGPGNWGPLALGASGSSNVGQNIESGYQGSVSVGDYLTTETGVQTGPIQTAFHYLLDEGQSEDPGGTFADHTLSDPRVLIVPMVDFSTAQGNSQVLVKGFAALWLVSVDNKDNIRTYFINEVAPGSTPSSSATNYGAYKAVLIQ